MYHTPCAQCDVVGIRKFARVRSYLYEETYGLIDAIYSSINKDISYRKFCQDMKIYCVIKNHNSVEDITRTLTKSLCRGGIL